MDDTQTDADTTALDTTQDAGTSDADAASGTSGDAQADQAEGASAGTDSATDAASPAQGTVANDDGASTDAVDGGAEVPGAAADLAPVGDSQSPSSWAALKAWIRRELHLHANGLTEDEREAANP